MKKRLIAVCLFVFLAVLLLILWQKNNFGFSGRDASIRVSEQDSDSSAKSNLKDTGRQVAIDTEGHSIEDPKLNALRGIAKLANRPIEFYGQVIDQDGNPVSGVKVTLQIRLMKEPLPGAIADLFEDAVTSSDANGLFSLSGAKGSVLTVKALEKEGYQPSGKATNRSYRYWDNENLKFKPNARNPELFRMWKKAGAEQLVRKGISSPLRYDGTAATFDLLTGNVANSGDLRVTLARNPTQITYGQRNYEWTLTIEVLNGGLLESNDEQMYRAPAEGYQPKMVVHMPADATDWTDEKSFNLYLKLRGGQQYGRAELKALVGSDRQTTPFYITSFVNPSGSRNLEYDPLQNVTRPPTSKP